MEDQDPGSFQTRKAHRIEQMVARWLRRSRDNSPRGRISVGDGPPGGLSQALTSVKLTVKIYKDVLLSDFGFHISQSLPLTVTSVVAGGTADGKLLPGDQILRMNNASVEDLSCEQAADILRESEESLLITLLRCTSGVPKSSFLTEEKRARLKINPVKVHFAEEVLVNGHSQGNSLLCMPNVLKVYLENGQTKAFKFEKNTSVKDIILTLKEKLSIHSIEYFALALEEQYNISKLHLLHEDELIEQVVQKKESYDYRCLFRVCFVPKDPLDLLQEDPVAFEYLYLQSCSDVLQERFAVEMKCSSALRLAALHIQERIYACAQPQKISLKYIEKDWGIENFISPTLLRNMRGKDIKKAISFHMKRNQSLLEPRQKQLISAAQLRLNYLQILGELKTYGGKIFNATLMLQDRESYIALLVGAKYGISQIINSKLNIMSTLAEFANISKIDLTEESEKVSMVKVYLQDVKLLTLLLESNSAKDLACLIAGYYRLFVHSAASIFIWTGKKQQTHRISAEEGYESRTCSDSEESSEVDSSLEILSDGHLAKFGRIKSPSKEDKQCAVLRGQSEDNSKSEEEKRGLMNSETSAVTDSASEASDSANTESRGCKTSGSSDSMDALEEDDLDACSSSRPEFFHFYTPTFKERLDQDGRLLTADSGEEKSRVEADGFLCLLELSRGANSGSPKTASTRSPSDPKPNSSKREPNGLALDPRFYDNSRMEYYSLCSRVSPASLLSHSSESSSSRNGSPKSVQEENVRRADPAPGVDSPVLNLPVGLEDTSSDDEFYDAADKLTPPDALSDPYTVSTKDQDDFCLKNKARSSNVGESLTPRPNKTESDRREEVKKYAKTLRKRRSFLQTDYTSQVTFPLAPSFSLESVDHVCCYERAPYLNFISHSPTVSSLQDVQGEPALLETKALALLTPLREAKSKTPSSSLMEMEPETMETKSVTDSIISPISAVRLKVDPEKRASSGVPLVTTNGARNHIHPHLSSCSFGHDAHSSASETSLQVQNGKAGVTGGPAGGTQSCSPNLLLETRESWVSSADQVVTPGDVALTKGDRLEAGFGHLSEMPRQEASRKYMEPVSSPGGQSGSGASPSVTHSAEETASSPKAVGPKKYVPPSFVQEEVEFPTGVRKPNGNVLFKEMPGNDSFQDEEDKKPSGLSNVIELLFDRNEPPCERALLPWQAFGTKPENDSPHQQTDPQEEGRKEAPQIASPPGKGLLSEGHLDSDILSGVQGFPSALLMPFQEGSSVAEHQSDSEGKREGDLRKAVLRVDLNPGQAQLNPPLCVIEETSRQMKGHTVKEWHCLDYFSTGCGNTSETREENLTLTPPSSDQSFLCLGPDNSPGVSVNHRAGSPLDFADMKEAILPKMEVEKCSCQLPYATCFRSLDPEADEENIDLEVGGSSAPLTTPPSSGNPIPVDLKSFELTRVRNLRPHLSENCPWPDYFSQALNQLQVRLCKSPVGFCQLLDNIVELQNLLEQFRAPGTKHSQDKCAWHFSENRNSLCVGSQKLMSSCQHVIKIDQSPEEMQRALQDTFQNLLQLTGVYFQFTNCGHCMRRHGDVTGNLKDVICTYYQFVQAAKLTCERGYRDLSVKLLARQCTALTAAVFCLTQQFQGSAAL
ncbi:FERM and PDZ domain-containing protein 1 [Tachyglossus aculeatus]|uniref:FERM and PDZ domain-containing protein 1 n=1 Tax=Tachyglossus aculeatus TaxID=9261 RepID=UPI0018F52B12|nr:FERM and PDZ domain-containing protein 1 [Tachyglossus aculeatus]